MQHLGLRLCLSDFPMDEVKFTEYKGKGLCPVEIFLSLVLFHDLRHTCFTRMARAGVDLHRIQKPGRWKTLSMVQRYAHHCPDSLRPGVEALRTRRKNYVTNSLQSGDKTLANRYLMSFLEPGRGFEPPTCGLRIRCSTC